MKTCTRLFAAIVVLALRTPGALAAESGAGAAPSPAIVPAPRVTETTAPPTAEPIRRPSSPLLVDIDAALAAERAQLDRLESEVRRAGSSQAALALQRQIAQVKQATEIELLRIQARHARREGRIPVAEQIESAVRELLMTPEERAARDRAATAAPAGR